jgi:hypothetical protein
MSDKLKEAIADVTNKRKVFDAAQVAADEAQRAFNLAVELAKKEHEAFTTWVNEQVPGIAQRAKREL